MLRENDQEGENICFEVIDVVKSRLPRSARILRARFSALSQSDIDKAMATLGEPNANEAMAVDARQELDLKVGIAFSRFQTRYFQASCAKCSAVKDESNTVFASHFNHACTRWGCDRCYTVLSGHRAATVTLMPPWCPTDPVKRPHWGSVSTVTMTSRVLCPKTFGSWNVTSPNLALL